MVAGMRRAVLKGDRLSGYTGYYCFSDTHGTTSIHDDD